ncbi:hypothetical protein RJ640_027676 [Escallonia rubra]|uniref:GAG-pre-integrase domain-containing protein n=1 Tax=Escallonia rubra TaxID=112253 RepID=A0AA88RPP3_9ASTE|nr:hypothetical protein RJ640_027676 [Escallonia rubra]
MRAGVCVIDLKFECKDRGERDGGLTSFGAGAAFGVEGVKAAGHAVGNGLFEEATALGPLGGAGGGAAGDGGLELGDRGPGGGVSVSAGVLVHEIVVLRLEIHRLLCGSIVIEEAAAASSYDIDSDTTKLWHMRLGHMSERGMDVLSKQGLLRSKKTGKLDFCKHCVFRKQCKNELNENERQKVALHIGRLQLNPQDISNVSQAYQEEEQPENH